jgi:hypothetical protein
VLWGAKTSSDGDIWSQQLPQIFSGHIHEYQIIGNICYVGTPLQQNYGEGTDKALMMIYLEDEKEAKFLVERIRLVSAPIRVTIHMNTEELPNFASKIPPGCMVKVVLHIDSTESAAIKQNPYYLAMKNIVDKVTEKIESNRGSIAEQMVNDFKEKGSLDPTKRIFDVDELVLAMLKDDPYTLNIYNTEIATI